MTGYFERKTVTVLRTGRRKGLYGFVIFLIVCMAGVFWLTDGKLEAVEQARKDMVHGIHELRYGKDQIPEEFR